MKKNKKKPNRKSATFLRTRFTVKKTTKYTKNTIDVSPRRRFVVTKQKPSKNATSQRKIFVLNKHNEEDRRDSSQEEARRDEAIGTNNKILFPRR